jgi:hypothetical protein
MVDVACRRLLQLARIRQRVLYIGTIGVRHAPLLPLDESVGALGDARGLVYDGTWDKRPHTGAHHPNDIRRPRDP